MDHLQVKGTDGTERDNRVDERDGKKNVEKEHKKAETEEVETCPLYPPTQVPDICIWVTLMIKVEFIIVKPYIVVSYQNKIQSSNHKLQ